MREEGTSNVTRDELVRAAHAIVYEGLTITDAAKRINRSRECLSCHINHNPDWLEIAQEIVNTEQRTARPAVWRKLVELAKSGNLSAITEVLDRIEGAVPQTLQAEVNATATHELGDTALATVANILAGTGALEPQPEGGAPTPADEVHPPHTDA